MESAYRWKRSLLCIEGKHHIGFKVDLHLEEIFRKHQKPAWTAKRVIVDM